VTCRDPGIKGGRRTRDICHVEVGWRGDMDVELRAAVHQDAADQLAPKTPLRTAPRPRLRPYPRPQAVEISHRETMAPASPKPDTATGWFRPSSALDESRNVRPRAGRLASNRARRARSTARSRRSPPRRGRLPRHCENYNLRGKSLPGKSMAMGRMPDARACDVSPMVQ